MMRKVHIFLTAAGALAVAVQLFLTGEVLLLFLFCGILFPLICFGVIYTLAGDRTEEPKPNAWLTLLFLGTGLRSLVMWWQGRDALDLIIALLWLEEAVYGILREIKMRQETQ